MNDAELKHYTVWYMEFPHLLRNRISELETENKYATGSNRIINLWLIECLKDKLVNFNKCDVTAKEVYESIKEDLNNESCRIKREY
ncbi:hypothetical protein [Bacillus cereus]|uniref:hypothetical protein n=1 Tax=Bacillus cereus TaxID=1396 RepID=UPI0025A041B2|nr:hypothetical protein [Bacillus cereus]MDM5465461.1 hypothetical protein [Bacillus cereus]